MIAGVVSQLTDTGRVITYSDIQNMAEELILEGYDCQQLLVKLQEHLTMGKMALKVPDVKKARLAEVIASSDYNLLMGGNEELNLLNTMSSIAQVLTSR